MAAKTSKKIEPEAPARPEERKSTAREYLESLVVTVILALYGTTFLIQAFKIPSSSMEDTLLIGDHLMVDKVGYAPSPGWDWLLPYLPVERDQIIVFRYPLDPKTYFVKRVVGLPGDRIHLVEKRLYRNGVLLDEPHVVHKSSHVEQFRDNFPDFSIGPAFPVWSDQLPDHLEDDELVVPPGQYFVMGDNRDFSSDSRYWGFVPRENIVGNPLLIYWSFETTSAEYQQTGVGSFAAKVLDVALHFPQKTRWGRLLHLIR